MKIVYNCLKTTDADYIRIELAKCQFWKTAVEWFDYCFTHITKCSFKSQAAVILTPKRQMKV